MRVPGLVVLIARVIDGHKADAVLDEPAGQQARTPERGFAIHPPDGFRLAADVERLHGPLLHAESGLHGFDLAFQFGIAVMAVEVQTVQLAEQIELLALLLLRELRVFDVGDELVNLHVSGDNAGRLKFGGEEAVAPESGTDDDLWTGPQDNVAGQVVVFTAQTIKQPGAHRRTNGLDVARVHLQQRRLVVRHVGLHRANDAAIVNYPPEVRQRLAHFNAAPAAGMEFVRRRHKARAFALLVEFAGGLLAFVFVQRGLGIERVNLRRSAVQKEENDPFGARREMRRPRGGVGEQGVGAE